VRALAAGGIPADFATGVKEFYFGLFHESVGEPNFRKRLETAFNVLRPFCRYSDYAALICAYYLYRVNCFEQVASLSEIPALSRMANFFLEPFGGIKARVTSHARQPAPASTEILVSNRDHALFQAVTSLLAGALPVCAEQLEVANRAGTPGLDPQGEERLAIVRARLARRSGRHAEADRAYGALANSATEAFRAEASAALKTQPART
jgi:hypothetical protein